MAPLKFKWKGLQKFLNGVKAKAMLLPQAVRKALFEEAIETMAAAKTLVPVDEGVLRASGHVQLPEEENGRVKVVFGFGGPAGSGNQGEKNSEDVGYAVRVHEDLTSHHTVGQAKYLEGPINIRKQDMPERLAKKINAFMEKG